MNLIEITPLSTLRSVGIALEISIGSLLNIITWQLTLLKGKDFAI